MRHVKSRSSSSSSLDVTSSISLTESSGGGGDTSLFNSPTIDDLNKLLLLYSFLVNVICCSNVVPGDSEEVEDETLSVDDSNLDLNLWMLGLAALPPNRYEAGFTLWGVSLDGRHVLTLSITEAKSSSA